MVTPLFFSVSWMKGNLMFDFIDYMTSDLKKSDIFSLMFIDLKINNIPEDLLGKDNKETLVKYLDELVESKLGTMKKIINMDFKESSIDELEEMKINIEMLSSLLESRYYLVKHYLEVKQSETS